MNEIRFKARLIPSNPKAAAAAAAVGVIVLLAGMGAAISWQIVQPAYGVLRQLVQVKLS